MNKEHTPGITRRFLQICSEAIQEGLVDNKRDFATSIGEHQQNLSLMDKGVRAPTLEHVVNACKKFGYSANWVMLNQGNKKMEKGKTPAAASIEQRVSSIETELARVGRIVSRTSSTSTKRVPLKKKR